MDGVAYSSRISTGYPQSCPALILEHGRAHWQFSKLRRSELFPMNLLETTKLVKRYSGRTVVDEVSFVLSQQEVVGILGRNGAGKTTTFRMIMGMVKPDSGVVTFDGYDVTSLPMYKRARRGMGYLSQENSIFRQLTV